MHREATLEVPNIERVTQAGGEPVLSQMPSGNIAGIGRGSVMVVLDRGDLRFSIGGHRTISRVE